MKNGLYSQVKDKWPKSGNHILASYDEDTIVVYQAYKPEIAAAIVKSGNFHNEECLKSGFSLNRMTWIKTNFLWMMYRSGWATKKDQERILAIRIKRAGFDEILLQAVVSSHHHEPTTGDQEWKTKIKTTDVVLQWDPDHYPDGSKVNSGRRAIQLGLRGEMLMKFSRSFIIDIKDVTEFVRTQYANCFNAQNGNPNQSEILEIPDENVYTPTDPQISQHIRLDSNLNN